MYAVRRETSPCVGSREEGGDRRTCPPGSCRAARGRCLLGCCFTNAGSEHEAERRDGDEAADHRAEAERRALEEHCCAGSARPRRRRPRRRRATRCRRRGSGAASPARPRGAAIAAGRRRATQRKPKTSAMRAADRDDGQLTTRPTRTHGDADAKPTGQRLGRRNVRLVAATGFQRRQVPRASPAVNGVSLLNDVSRDASVPIAVPRRSSRDPVLGPAPVDERPDLGAHLDLRRPLARALLGPLCVASIPSLPPKNCSVGAWSSWSSGPSVRSDVALRVDVGADAEEDLLVVVHVHPLVDDDDRLRQAEQAEPPDRVHHLLRVAGERLADRDDARSCGTRPRPGGRSRRSPGRSSGSPAGRSARSPCRATRPPAAACRRRSTGRSRRAASSSPSRGRPGTARRGE